MRSVWFAYFTVRAGCQQATARAPFIRLEVTKSGKRREAPLNAESYAALVSLGPKESGRVFRRQNLRKAYENAVNNAKLDNVNFHTLRHTFASWAVMRGVSLKELQERSATRRSP